MDFLNDILQYSYISNALIACVLSGITCGIIGTYIVARRMVFLCGGMTVNAVGDALHGGKIITHTHTFFLFGVEKKLSLPVKRNDSMVFKSL